MRNLTESTTSVTWIALGLWVIGGRGGIIPVHAEDTRFEIEAGVWDPELDMIARIDDDATQGTEFSLEDDIGVDNEESLPGLQFLFSMGERRRHRLFVSYAETNYDGQNVLDDPITIGDTTYGAGEGILLDLDYALARLYYGFTFLSKEKFQFGFQTGLYAVVTDGTFEATTSENEDFDIVAPLPVIGLHFALTPGKRHQVRALATGITVDAGDVDGDALDWEIQCKFFPLQWLGLGVGIRGFDLDVEVDEEGKLDLDQDGVFYDVTFRW